MLDEEKQNDKRVPGYTEILSNVQAVPAVGQFCSHFFRNLGQFMKELMSTLPTSARPKLHVLCAPSAEQRVVAEKQAAEDAMRAAEAAVAAAAASGDADAVAAAQKAEDDAEAKALAAAEGAAATQAKQAEIRRGCSSAQTAAAAAVAEQQEFAATLVSELCEAGFDAIQVKGCSAEEDTADVCLPIVSGEMLASAHVGRVMKLEQESGTLWLPVLYDLNSFEKLAYRTSEGLPYKQGFEQAEKTAEELDALSPDKKNAALARMSPDERDAACAALLPQEKKELASMSREERAKRLRGMHAAKRAAALAKALHVERATLLAELSPEEREATLVADPSVRIPFILSILNTANRCKLYLNCLTWNTAGSERCQGESERGTPKHKQLPLARERTIDSCH